MILMELRVLIGGPLFGLSVEFCFSEKKIEMSLDKSKLADEDYFKEQIIKVLPLGKEKVTVCFKNGSLYPELFTEEGKREIAFYQKHFPDFDEKWLNLCIEKTKYLFRVRERVIRNKNNQEDSYEKTSKIFNERWFIKVGEKMSLDNLSDLCNLMDNFFHRFPSLSSSSDLFENPELVKSIFGSEFPEFVAVVEKNSTVVV